MPLMRPITLTMPAGIFPAAFHPWQQTAATQTLGVARMTPVLPTATSGGRAAATRQRGGAGSGLEKQEPYDWGRLAAAIGFVGLQVATFSYPPLRETVRTILPEVVNITVMPGGAIANILLGTALEVFNQSLRRDGERVRLEIDIRKLDPFQIASFIFCGFVFGIASKSFAGTSLYSFFANPGSDTVREFPFGEEIGWNPFNPFPLFEFLWQSIVLNTLACLAWLPSFAVYLATSKESTSHKKKFVWNTFLMNLKIGWIRRALAFRFSTGPETGLFYLISHGLMLLQQGWVNFRSRSG